MLVYAIGDLHLSPNISNKRLAWIGRDIKQTKPDLVFQCGDMSSMNSLCKYEANDTFLGKIKPIYLEDLAHTRNGLELLDSEGAHSFQKHVTLGNHEDRIESFANRNPEVYALFQEHYYDVLAEHNWEYTPYGKMKKFEGVNFTHVPFTTLGKPMGGQTVEWRAGALTTTDLVFGHSHRANLVSIPKLGHTNPIKVLNLGCALPQGHIERYALHSLTGWSYGVWKLRLKKGRIVQWEFTPMNRLEEKYK